MADWMIAIMGLLCIVVGYVCGRFHGFFLGANYMINLQKLMRTSHEQDAGE